MSAFWTREARQQRAEKKREAARVAAEELAAVTAEQMRRNPPISSGVRRYVEWYVNIYPNYYEAIRYENGQVHLLGRSPIYDRSSYEDIRMTVESNRIMVRHDPMAIEVKPVEFRVR